MSIEHIVLIGLNFQLTRSTGDKNFWANMIPIISSKLKRITILSIRSHHVPDEQFVMDGCFVDIKYIPPVFLYSSDSKSRRRKIFWKQGAFPRWMGVLEKLLSFKTLLKELNILSVASPYQCIHFMDNMGFINRMVANLTNVPVLVSAMSYQDKKPRWLYRLYLLISYKHKKLTIIPYSLTLADKLLDMGLDSSNVCRIPWGVSVPAETTSVDFKKEVTKERLGLNGKMPLILWAGYIQQISKKDFLFAYDMAKRSKSSGLNVSYVFAFKPESFEKDFESLHSPTENLFVIHTDVAKFKLLLKVSDLLFSPVVNPKCILAPPLTWIEIMSQGTPILTTSVLGASEIIEDGVTGIIVDDMESMQSKIASTISAAESMQSSCKKKIERCYNIINVADLYLDIWSKSYEIYSK